MEHVSQECFHQKHIRIYLDFDYDAHFDSDAEHFCLIYQKSVIPKKHCGSDCPVFRPLNGGHSRGQINQVDANATDKYARDGLRYRLEEVCHEIEENARYLETQCGKRESRWRDADAWLSLQDSRPEAINREIEASEHSLADKRRQKKNADQRLNSARSDPKLKDIRDIEQLWLEDEQCKDEVIQAKDNVKQAYDKPIERQKKQVEHERLYQGWEDATARVPMLRELCDIARDRIGAMISKAPRPMSNSNIEVILRRIRQIRDYSSTEDVSLTDLGKLIKNLKDLQ